MIPGLHQIVIQRDFIDRIDGSFRIRICREQHTFRFGEQLAGIFEELHAAHDRHALIRQKKRDDVAALLQKLDSLKRRRARIGLDDTVVATILLTQVALNSVEDRAIVVDGYDRWFSQANCTSMDGQRSATNRPTAPANDS